jgi:hypothetical protein
MKNKNAAQPGAAAESAFGFESSLVCTSMVVLYTGAWLCAAGRAAEAQAVGWANGNGGETIMGKLKNEVVYDIHFIKGHKLQPVWFKVLKIFILLGAFIGYAFLFGLLKTIIFGIIFLSLSMFIHFIYRLKTDKFTKTWLDFIVQDVNGKNIPISIGKFYYSAVIMNVLIAFILSQLLG